MAADRDAVVTAVLDTCGQTYADQAGIRLADKPSPLYQMLVLATLLSARITADIAVAAARELFAAGYRTPAKMAAASWQDRVDALGRGHYRRYDERTSTMLGDGAELLSDRWRGDLRRLHTGAGDDVPKLRGLLTEFPGVGEVGAAIFLREAQAVWRGLQPFADDRVAEGASRLGLPGSGPALAELVSAAELPRLVAGLVRVALDKQLAAAVRKAAD